MILTMFFSIDDTWSYIHRVIISTTRTRMKNVFSDEIIDFYFFGFRIHWRPRIEFIRDLAAKTVENMIMISRSVSSSDTKY